jgi:hypothetical protein
MLALMCVHIVQERCFRCDEISMSEVQQSIFIVSREDRAVEPKTVIAEALVSGVYRIPMLS